MCLESSMRLESRALVGVPVGCGNIKQLQLTIQLLGSQQHFLISSIIYYQALAQT